MTDETGWAQALATRDYLDQYESNAIGLFALDLRFSIDDIHSVASESITDGSDDKKCDLIYLDREEGIAVLPSSTVCPQLWMISDFCRF